MTDSTKELLRTLGKNFFLVGAAIVLLHIVLFGITALFSGSAGFTPVTFAFAGLLAVYLSPYLAGVLLALGSALWLSGKK
ncbi:MAG: hypothetical protein Q4D73_06905 [Actinomycetaceae bacterium]|nr:hypothetical protein [Actinomycetaceae bacterium]